MKTRSCLFLLLFSVIAACISAQESERLKPENTPSRAISTKKEPIKETDRRTALVIGNGDYKVSPLKNPVNDAEVMSEQLEALGFDVIKGINLNQKQMKKKISAFGKQLKKGGTGLFYYAGHGMQVQGNNYLIPVESVIQSEEDVEYEAVNAGRVLAQMDAAKNGLNIVILDACRDNPFARSFRSSSKGLAYMDAPGGTMIAYATAPGSVASDGAGNNGLYTSELVKEMAIPGKRIEDIFKKVRTKVRLQTENRQIPWESSSLEGDFYFAKASADSEKTPIVATAPLVHNEPADIFTDDIIEGTWRKTGKKQLVIEIDSNRGVVVSSGKNRRLPGKTIIKNIRQQGKKWIAKRAKFSEKGTVKGWGETTMTVSGDILVEKLSWKNDLVITYERVN